MRMFPDELLKPGALVMVATSHDQFLVEVIAVCLESQVRIMVMDLGTGKPCSVETANCSRMKEERIQHKH